MSGVLDTLAAASPASRTVWLIVDKALHSEWHRLNGELAAAADRDVKKASLAASETRKVIDAMEAIRDRVDAAKVGFEFEQLDWADYLELQSQHVPRNGNLLDRLNGYNVQTFIPALIRASCVKVIGQDDEQAAADVPEKTWGSLFKSFNIQQVEELQTGAHEVNKGRTSVPPSARSLLDSQDSRASLAQPSPGTPPRSGSAGGSRRTSPRSSTAKKAAAKKAASSGSSRG